MQMLWLLLMVPVWMTMPQAQAGRFDYGLEPRQIAPDTWLVEGRRESFSRDNGGHIVNVAFIVTEAGVVLFDSGPSRRFGEQLRAAIAGVTDRPVVHVFNSHAHPDHFLGNQAFADATIWALPGTAQQIARDGDGLAENLYGLVGDWMRGTEAMPPARTLEQERFEVGGHRLRFLAFKGHTGADLVMLDEATGVLFAADMVFHQRALTTPQTPGLALWRDELSQLAALDYRWLVPGHGPVDEGGRAIDQTRDYLDWLDHTLRRSADAGLTMTEVMALPIDNRFDSIRLTRYEFARTVAHLYPRYEQQAFH
ncbi:quinoprotein relay system zinc metallohydrolase 1 [Marinobacterium aestuariivivens]|uniref:Quinoprotein relay system zinc metallohydrolase 1 n=1 Tax=Marinobacterium aestuariivivens TaxID=1698799 RepID=A0ABW2A6E6_9GAMM